VTDVRKLGLLVGGPPPVDWATTHASVPFPTAPENGTLRLFFSSRDDQGRSHVGYAKVDLEQGAVTEYSPQPLLSPGELGAFDDNGAMGSCIVRHGADEYLSYSGWSLGLTVPFYTYVGCAVRSGGAFTRVSRGPVLPRTDFDPYFTTAPWVLVEGGVWRMWYSSGTGWGDRDGQPLHRYRIAYAESDDGVRWRRDGTVCIDFADADEFALTRPCVVRDGNVYRMWYSRRGLTYRIGYAESDDGISWTRKDEEAGIDVSPRGWDSQMIEYPCIVDDGDSRYLFYNGNGYGETGIGWAVIEA
jgi:predicted GH43/DUF377 family glycosyl hydrolase